MKDKPQGKAPEEDLKVRSNYLRGTIRESLADPVTGAVAGDDEKLLKFHGIYQQDDRDLRDERRRQKLEPAFQFMLRVRLPGGVCRPDQWLAIDDLAGRYGGGMLRLTTRQTFQLHYLLKHQLKPLIQGLDRVGLDSIAACGDVNRTVTCGVNPHRSALHREVYTLAKEVSDRFVFRGGAWQEIWLDAEPPAGDAAEPLYGPTYLPRKFKIGFVVPPVNDIEVDSQCLGFIAIVDRDHRLAGFNVTIGGGLGRTDNHPETFARLADTIGFCRPDQVLAVAEAVLTLQRDHGDRSVRTHARFKYTVEDHGADWCREQIEQRAGLALEPAREVTFEHNGDPLGWVESDDGLWHYTLFIEEGRIRDREDGMQLRSALREIAGFHDGEFRLTPNQNLVISRVPGERCEAIMEVLERHRVVAPEHYGVLRRNAMACVAFPTCSLAMAESERYLPSLLEQIERLAAAAGIGRQPITIRMTGCPNGCARPYLAEIGFTGRGPGKYNLYLGGAFNGRRLNQLYLENVGESRILDALKGLFHDYAQHRHQGEHFGDYLIRAGHVPEVTAGRHF